MQRRQRTIQVVITTPILHYFIICNPVGPAHHSEIRFLSLLESFVERTEKLPNHFGPQNERLEGRFSKINLRWNNIDTLLSLRRQRPAAAAVQSSSVSAPGRPRPPCSAGRRRSETPESSQMSSYWRVKGRSVIHPPTPITEGFQISKHRSSPNSQRWPEMAISKKSWRNKFK